MHAKKLAMVTFFIESTFFVVLIFSFKLKGYTILFMNSVTSVHPVQKLDGMLEI